MAAIRPRKDREGIVIGYQTQVQRKGYPSQTKTFRSKADAQAWQPSSNRKCSVASGATVPKVRTLR